MYLGRKIAWLKLIFYIFSPDRESDSASQQFLSGSELR